MEKLSSINSVRMQLKKLTEENEFLKNKNNDLELMLKNSNIYDPMN